MALDVVTYALCKKYTDKQVKQIIESFSEGMKFKGSVETIADLPSSPSTGDLYIIKDPGCKAVWNKTEWVLFDQQVKKTSQLINDSGFVTEEAIQGKADKTYVDAEVLKVENKIPTKTSQLTNDSGFLTQHQDISGKADVSALNTEISNRTSADTTLQTNITNEVNARESAINAVNESINQESITREQADTTLQNNINLKQDKLTAEKGVKLTGNVVSAKYDNDTIKINNNGELFADIDISSKQDKLTAGENISIINNVISATGTAKMGRTFTTKVTVGNLLQGTQISENDTVADILYKILYGQTGDVVNLYYGASDDIPVDLTGLTIIKDQDVDTILQNGKAVKIITGNVETKEGQHAVFACGKGTRLVSLSRWLDETETFDIPFISVDKGSYNLYYLEGKTYDEDLGGTMYHFKFVEGA